jgi:tetratricopeptide (TPR) repeat protein
LDHEARPAAPLRVVRGAKRPAAAPAKDRKKVRHAPGSERRKARGPGPKAVREELLRLGGPRGARFYDQLVRAADALSADREKDALRLLRPLRSALPQSAAVRELLGVALYRSGRYDQAAEELEAYVAFCGAVDQHPALMDCYRAMKDYDRVKALWDELGQTASAPDVVAEGRIVYAGSLADRGRVREAIGLLDRRAAEVKNVKEFHLRLWYALADLEERAGNLPRARTLFERISRNDPSFADVMERLVALN